MGNRLPNGLGRSCHCRKWYGEAGLGVNLASPFDPLHFLLDDWDAWTLNASLTTSSSYRKCSKRRTLDHSAQATSLPQIEGTTKCLPIVLGSGCGSILASVADLSPLQSN